MADGPAETHDQRYERGLEKLKEVYAGDVVSPPRGTAFSDVMLETLFAEVWTRDVLVFLVHYVGYPRCSGMVAVVEQAIAEFEAASGPADGSG